MPDSVSVIVPVFNGEATLGETLWSARAQTYERLEIVVVDDGSSDASAEIAERHRAEDPRIKIITQNNGGVARARNAGIASSTAKWIATLDADDVWHPRKIELQLRAAVSAPESPGLVYCWTRRIDSEGKVVCDYGMPRYSGSVYYPLLVRNFVTNASVAMLRRDVVLAAGGFDPGLQDAGAQGAEDIDLYLRVAKRAPAALAPYFLVGYRQVDGSMSRSAARMRQSLDLVLEKHADAPAGVMRLARAHYDIYTASLHWRSRNMRAFVHACARAMASAPITAAGLLAFSGIRMIQEARRHRHAPSFHDLRPDTSLSNAWEEAFERFQARHFRDKAVGGKLP